MRRLLMLSAAAMFVACKDSSPTAPMLPIPNIAGDWSGTLSVTPTLRGAIHLSLTQAPEQAGLPDPGSTNMLDGTWSTTFDSTADGGSGTVFGMVRSDSALSASLQPSPPQGTCALQISATLTSATSMIGRVDTYTWSPPYNCALAASWQFTAVRD